MSKVIEFYISPDYDAHTHRIYVEVPENFDNMSDGEKETFLQEEAQSYMNEHIDYGALVHESLDAAMDSHKSSWGDNPDSAEQWY